MADTSQTLSSILSALAQNFRNQIVSAINRRSVALQTIPIVAGAGKNVAWDAEFDGMVGETFSDGADAANFGSDAIVPATLSWGLYRANFHVTDLALAAAASTMTPAQIVDLWGRNMLKAFSKLATTINVDIFGGSSNIVGFDTAVATTNNTYANIDRSQAANTHWNPNVVDPGATTVVALADIRGDIATTIYKECGEQPDLAFCEPAVFVKLGSLFEETRRRNQDVTGLTINTARGPVLLDASVGAMQFEGCTFIKDKDATANRIYYVNSQYVEMDYLPQPVAPLAMESAQMIPQITDGFGMIPLGVKAKALAIQGASRRASLQAFLQLAVTKPNACGARLHVANS